MPQDLDSPLDRPTIDAPAPMAASTDPTQSVAPAVDAPAPVPVSSDPTRSVAATVDAQRRSRSRAAWFALVVGVIVLIFMLVFILQNNVPTQFTFLAWNFTIPLGVAVLFAGIGGALITATVGTVRMVVLGRTAKRLGRASRAGS